MRYKITKLYDSPEAPKGTVYHVLRESNFLGKQQYEYYQEGETYIRYTPIGGNFDNPKWYKKEIEYDCLTDLKCPKCSDTRGDFFSKSYYISDYDSDRYGTQFAVGFECVCGHKRILYGTNYGIESLKREMELEKMR